MVVCLERGADLHMAQLMPLPLTVSCFCKIQIGFTFLVPARERCRISPTRFLAECCKRQLNQGSFVLLYFRLFTFSDFC